MRAEDHTFNVMLTELYERVEKLEQRLGQFAARCNKCGNEFLRNELNGGLCPECHAKHCDDALDSISDTYGAG